MIWTATKALRATEQNVKVKTVAELIGLWIDLRLPLVDEIEDRRFEER